MEEHDLVQWRGAAKEMLLDLPAPFHLRCVAEDVIEPKVRPLLRQTRCGIHTGLGVRRDVVPYEQMVQFIGGYYRPNFSKRIDRAAKIERQV